MDAEKDKHHLNPSPKRPKTRGNRRKDMSQNKLGRQKTKTKMGLVGSGRKGQTPPKSEPKTTKNARKPQERHVPKQVGSSKKQRALLWGPLKTTKWPQKKFGLQPSHNLAWTKTKMDLVGSGCEKAKHHLNPSPKRPKTRGNRRRKKGRNVTYGTHKKEKKEIASSISNLQAPGKTCPKTSSVRAT